MGREDEGLKAGQLQLTHYPRTPKITTAAFKTFSRRTAEKRVLRREVRRQHCSDEQEALIVGLYLP